MRPFVLATATVLSVPLLVPLAGAAPAAQVTTGTSPAPPAAACDPFKTPAQYAGAVPSGRQVLGFQLGSREVTVAESDRYVAAVDAASDRVSAGVMATSQLGRPLTYAVVGEPADVARAKQAARTLRDPGTSVDQAARVAAQAPAIAWIAGNVHGNEESGTDASLRLLRDLADRTDCAAAQIRVNTVVVIVPTQNPDGREADERRNAYGFDMNRDWFARTQPETDGKLELLRRLPPVLFIDDHEMGADGFFFPPNADPVYHDIADRSIRWINNLYGAAVTREFNRESIPFFNYDIYDLLYMGYGDTVPTTGFLGAGMTFEKNNEDPISMRTHQQQTALWASLSTLAQHKASVLAGWAASHRQAYRQGVDGTLEPNHVFAPGNEVQAQVPDERVRHYFIEDTPDKAAEVQALVRRLQRMDVQVRRLTAPLTVPDYTAYGRAPASRTLPAGTYWVPMAQAQKHWIQAMMGEDSYVPFPYFYDVTAWSGPLLFNVPAGRSGAQLTPASSTAPAAAAAKPPTRPAHAPSIGLWQTDDSTTAVESGGWMRWLFEKGWRIPYRPVTTAGISESALAPIDVLVVPDGDAAGTYDALTPSGRAALREWLAAGGRFIGLRGGAELAARLQLTTASLTAATSDVPGSLVRAAVAPGPLAPGVGRFVWSFYAYDFVMRTNDAATVAVRYPSARSRDFFVSGYERGAEELAGTAAVVDEAYAAGRVVAFASEPNFRAFTDGTQKVLWNAMFGADPVRAKAAGPQSSPQDLATLRARSAAAAASLPRLDGRMVLTVRSGSTAAARAVLSRYAVRPDVTDLGGGLVRMVADVGTSDESPIARKVARDLRGLGSGVVALRIP